MNIKTGDKVRIIAGKDKGKEGKVIQVFPKLGKVVIEGVNIAKRHLRSRGNQPGQKIEFPAPVQISNVMLLAAGGKTGRVGSKILEREGKSKKIRVVRSKGKEVEVE